ncbi:NlpC/P60 family protein [Humidesulfovibrio mexicanus]|uniref:NlpC/P60 family protein n=1 Tax=Humidesulfovibrio mexicanus TaxID=147047 RepID=A0A239AXJ6_9BACT|nr:NlpC/P60 family protein [Humidesulfovibrio mexicanus]SNS00456.1 NlpC/P60 family protein [Humidesulfovibrio mexicanus]
MPPAWVNGYVGVPYLEEGRTASGCDCYGLVRLVQWQERGIAMPELSHLAYRKRATPEERIALGESIKAYDAAAVGWTLLQPGEPMREFDVIWLRHGGPIHFGVAIDRRTMLHVEEGADAVLERLDTVQWKNRILGVYRHA